MTSFRSQAYQPLPRELTLDVTAPIDQPSGSGFDLTVMLRNGSIGSLAEELVSVNVPLRTAELENFSISDNLIELNIDMDTYDPGSPPANTSVWRTMGTSGPPTS